MYFKDAIAVLIVYDITDALSFNKCQKWNDELENYQEDFLKFIIANKCDLVGRQKALEILLSCRTIDSKEAENLGLCDKLLDDDDGQDILKETQLWLEELVQHDQSVISAIKQSLTKADDVNEYEKERKLFAPLWAGPANLKALSKNLKH